MLQQKSQQAIGRIGPASAFFGILVITAFVLFGQNREGIERKEAIFHLQAIQPEFARTRILVLATFHLKQIAETFKPGMLDSLVSRLEKFRPDVICIETLPGSRVQEIELRQDAGPLYADLLNGFASAHLKMGKPALDLLRTTPQAAAIKVRELLAAAGTAQPRKLAPGERASLALWMLAAYDPDSATLQWSYLSAKDKKTQKVIPAESVELLNSEAAKINEVPAIAARLARTLGLEKLEAVDEFEDLDSYAELLPQLEKDFEGNRLLASVLKAPIYGEQNARLAECLRKGDLLPQYVFLNSREFARADVEAQWGVFLRTHMASGTDRGRLGLWENRNLKIAARIRAVAALHPGGRILVIYGAAHKPFLDAYLSGMADVELVDVGELLSE